MPNPTTNIPEYLARLSAFAAPSATSPTGQETYSDIAYAMRTNAVPISAWEATQAAEDPSLDPSRHYGGTIANPEDSWGLWQFNRDGGLGVNSSTGQAYPVATLTDPYAETQMAARIMGDAVQQYVDATGDQSDAGALGAIAQAGWPGSVALATQQGRFANLAAIEAYTGQQGLSAPPAQGTAPQAGPASPTAPQNPLAAVFQGVAAGAATALGLPSFEQLAALTDATGNSLRANAVEFLHSTAFFVIGLFVLLAGVAFIAFEHGDAIAGAVQTVAAPEATTVEDALPAPHSESPAQRRKRMTGG